MTQTELVLFKELIKEAVKVAVKDEMITIRETIEKALKKDIKEVKLLLAAQIKEAKNAPKYAPPVISEKREELSDNKKKMLNTLAGMGFKRAQPGNDPLKNANIDPMTKSILMETARNMNQEDLEALTSPSEAFSPIDPFIEEEGNFNIQNDLGLDDYTPNGMPEFPY